MSFLYNHGHMQVAAGISKEAAEQAEAEAKVAMCPARVVVSQGSSTSYTKDVLLLACLISKEVGAGDVGRAHEIDCEVPLEQFVPGFVHILVRGCGVIVSWVILCT